METMLIKTTQSLTLRMRHKHEQNSTISVLRVRTALTYVSNFQSLLYWWPDKGTMQTKAAKNPKRDYFLLTDFTTQKLL